MSIETTNNPGPRVPCPVVILSTEHAPSYCNTAVLQETSMKLRWGIENEFWNPVRMESNSLSLSPEVLPRTSYTISFSTKVELSELHFNIAAKMTKTILMKSA